MQYLDLDINRFGHNPCGGEIWAYLKKFQEDPDHDELSNTRLDTAVLIRLWTCLKEGDGMRKSIIHCAVEVSYVHGTMAEFEDAFVASGHEGLISAFCARRLQKQTWAKDMMKMKERKSQKDGKDGSGSKTSRRNKTIGREYMVAK
jgi:hypothetical protein